MNAEAILRKLAEIRNAIPQVPQPRVERPHQFDSVDDFELAAIADAVEAMSDDLEAAIDEAHVRLLAQCLEVYYAAEELARDPANAHLIPHVEEMRRTFESSYGRAIPERQASLR